MQETNCVKVSLVGWTTSNAKEHEQMLLLLWRKKIAIKYRAVQLKYSKYEESGRTQGSVTLHNELVFNVSSLKCGDVVSGHSTSPPHLHQR